MSKGALANTVLVIGPGILGKDAKCRLACIEAQDAHVRKVLLRRILLRKDLHLLRTCLIHLNLFLSAVLGFWITAACTGARTRGHNIDYVVQ